MNSVLRISEAASLAMHAMMALAAQPEHRRSAQDLARQLDVSLAHLAKVLQRLAKAGYVASTRGPKGGFTLALPADYKILR